MILSPIGYRTEHALSLRVHGSADDNAPSEEIPSRFTGFSAYRSCTISEASARQSLSSRSHSTGIDVAVVFSTSGTPYARTFCNSGGGWWRSYSLSQGDRFYDMIQRAECEHPTSANLLELL